VPAQSSPAFSVDSANEKTTLVYVCAKPSDVIGPPLTGGMTFMMLRERSGLMTSQLCPRSCDFRILLPATYSRLGSCGENTIGYVQLNRYLWSLTLCEL